MSIFQMLISLHKYRIMGIMKYIDLKDRKHVYMTYIKPLIEANKIEKTIPNKPKSKNQKYISK